MSSALPTQVNVYEAKASLSRLLARVRAGEEIVIAKAGTPIARLVPYEERPAHRVLGTLAGSIHFSDDYEWTDAELDELGGDV